MYYSATMKSGYISLCLYLVPHLASAERYFVTPHSNASCTNEEAPCLSISEYAAQPPGYFSSNVTLIFLPGEHNLYHNFSFNNLRDISFTISEPEVTISCLHFVKIEILNTTSIAISNILFTGCSGNAIMMADVFTLENLSVKGVADEVSQTTFFIKDVLTVHVSNCSFVFNEDREISLYEISRCGVLAISNSSIEISNSEFKHNSALQEIHDSIGGVFCACDSHISITSCTFTGYHSGIIYAEDSDIVISKSNFLHNKGYRVGFLYAKNCKIIEILSSSFLNNYVNGKIAYIESSTVTIRDCSFKENNSSEDGGVMSIKNTTLSAHSTTFEYNSAINAGGVIQISQCEAIFFSNCSFIQNKATYGGVISSFQGIVSLEDCIFYLNTAIELHDIGFGAVINSDSSEIIIARCIFTNNTAEGSGGCMHALNSSINISESVFENNHATYGGAITVVKGIIKIDYRNSSESYWNKNTCEDVKFHGNSANDGGALNLIESTAHIECVSFKYNNAESRGGAILIRTNTNINLTDIYFYQNHAQGIGGVIFSQYFCDISTSGYLIVDNCSGDSGVMYMSNCNANFTGNSIFSNVEGSLIAHFSQVYFSGETRFVNGSSMLPSEGGALTVIRSKVYFYSSLLLEQNYAIMGGAIFAKESTLEIYGVSTFSNNSANKFGGGGFMYRSDINFRNDTNFQGNTALEGGGIYASISSSISFYSGSSNFINNSAEHAGGAVYLDQTSTIYIIKDMVECNLTQWYCNADNWQKLTFTDNNATYGGALYVNDINAESCVSMPFEEDTSNGKGCFIQSIAAYVKADDWVLPADNINLANVYFTDNTALEGPILYGGLLDRCAIDEFSELKEILNATLQPFSYFDIISSGNITVVDIDSDPVRVCFCTDNDELNCIQNDTKLIIIKREQTFNVSVITVNQVNISVAGNILGYLSSESSRMASDNQSNQATDGTCTNLTYNILSVSDREELFLYAKGPCNDQGLSKIKVIIEYESDCPLGFKLSNSSLLCECDPVMQPYITTGCDITTETVERKENFWIDSILTENESEIIIHKYCPHDYCYPPTKSVNINLTMDNASDYQCAFNRSGILCGSCQTGYSLTLGSSRCEICSHYWLFLIIPFAIAGVGLVALMMICNLTVATGTMNGPIFYANILIANRSVFFPYQQESVLTVFVSWLGLNLGIATCFYNGMDAFGKMLVQTSFEVYLILLTFLVIFAGQFTKLANIFHKFKLKPVHTLATLVMLSYEKLSRNIFSLLSFTTLKYPNKTSEIKWLFDPNLKYMEGEHKYLAILGAVILLTGLVFNITLLFSKQLVAISKYSKINEFMQAFHAPFKPNHRYWAGFLLFIRNISYITSEFLIADGNPSYSLHFVFSLVMGILIIKYIFACTSNYPGLSLSNLRKRIKGHSRLNESTSLPPLRDEKEKDDKSCSVSGIVYQSPILDLLETTFLLNIAVLTYFTLNNQKEKYQNVIFSSSSAITLVTFVGILIYHLCVYTQAPHLLRKYRGKTKIITKLKSYGSTTKHQQPTSSEITVM